MIDGKVKQRIGLWLAVGLVLSAAFLAFPLTLTIPLVDPDEGLHAAIAQEMVERGDWITPRFLGEPFYDKPILFTWFQAASLKLFGMNEAAVRLPSMLFALAGIVSTGLVAWRLFSPETGVLAAVMYAVMVLPVALTQVAVHDVALVPWVNLGLLAFWEADRASSLRARIAATVAAGLILGLSCLTKGLVGVAIVGVAYGGYLLVARRLTTASVVRGCAALALAGVVASGWYGAMEYRHPGYLHYYFVERHLLGYATHTQLHASEPWWYYLPIVVGGGLPWTVYLPGLALNAWQARGRESCPDFGLMLVSIWAIGGTVLLSLAGSKLVTYVWPIFPALSILTAVLWTRMFAGALTVAARRFVTAVFVLSALAGPFLLPAALVAAQIILDLRLGWAVWLAACVSGAGLVVPLIFWRHGWRRVALAGGILSAAPQFMLLMAYVGPAAAAVNSAPDLAAYLNRAGDASSHVIVVEDRVGSLVFYLAPALRADLHPGQFTTVRPSRLLSGTAAAPEALVAVADWNLSEAGPLTQLAGRPYSRAGRYRLYGPANTGVPRTAHPQPAGHGSLIRRAARAVRRATVAGPSSRRPFR